MEHDDGSADEKRDSRQIVVRRAADAGAVRPFPGKRRPRYGGRFGDCALAWRHRGFGGCRDWRGGCGGRVRFVAHHRGDSPARTCRKAFPQLRRENRLLADRPRGASRRPVCRHRASYGDRRGHIRPAKLSGAANHVRGTWRRDVSGAGRRTACQRIGRAAAQISPFHTVRRGVHGDSAVAFHRADESADAGRRPDGRRGRQRG